MTSTSDSRIRSGLGVGTENSSDRAGNHNALDLGAGDVNGVLSYTHLFFWIDFNIPTVPWTAGPVSSFGSVTLKWKGEAV